MDCLLLKLFCLLAKCVLLRAKYPIKEFDFVPLSCLENKKQADLSTLLHVFRLVCAKYIRTHVHNSFLAVLPLEKMHTKPL